MKLRTDKSGYNVLGLYGDNGFKNVFVHRLVLLTYNYRPDHKHLCVNHIDRNRTNNSLYNLEWCTVSENNNYSAKFGVFRGENKPNSVLTPETVKYLRSIVIPGHVDFGYHGLAVKLGVSDSCIRHACVGLSWKHV